MYAPEHNIYDVGICTWMMVTWMLSDLFLFLLLCLVRLEVLLDLRFAYTGVPLSMHHLPSVWYHFLSLWSLGNMDIHLDVGSMYLHTLIRSDLLAGNSM